MGNTANFNVFNFFIWYQERDRIDKLVRSMQFHSQLYSKRDQTQMFNEEKEDGGGVPWHQCCC